MACRSFSILASVCCLVTICSFVNAEEELRVFALVNADCREMASLLDVISQGELITASDRRTNSLVIKAPAESLVIIEALLMKLDVAVEDRKEHGGHSEAERQEAEEQERKERAELESMRQREQMEVEQHEQNLSGELDLLRRRFEMVAAESKLEQATMEAEIKSIAMEAEALSLRRKAAVARHESEEDNHEEVAMLSAKLESVQRNIEILKMKLEFHMNHVAPFRQLEIGIQLREKEHQLSAFHAERKIESEE